MKRKHRILSEDAIRIIMVVVGSVISTLILAFSVLAITQIQQANYGIANGFLFATFILLGIARLLAFLKNKTKTNFLRFIILFAVNIALGVLILFARFVPYFYGLCGGIYCLTIIASRVFKIVQNHTVRSIVFNSLVIGLMVLLALGLFIPNEENPIGGPTILLCTIMAFAAFSEVLSNATSGLKLKVLFKIIIKTYALEVILGLVTIMVAFSLIFYLYEPGITTFEDGLWFSFAVVTTIGFGDLKVTTLLGRILTVILGCYGIIVVAVITSIIVNFYNETAGKKDKKSLTDIKKEHDKEEKQ